LNGLITHKFSPLDCERAYALASDHREQAVGILFDWTVTPDAGKRELVESSAKE
jgi:hypothetical protein